eukprot:8408158-Pyramimonas_sp.AAC.1
MTGSAVSMRTAGIAISIMMFLSSAEIGHALESGTGGRRGAATPRAIAMGIRSRVFRGEAKGGPASFTAPLAEVEQGKVTAQEVHHPLLCLDKHVGCVGPPRPCLRWPSGSIGAPALSLCKSIVLRS